MIEVHELTKRYGPVTAVDRLSFTVRPGGVTGFLGPNGAGKSTTMRAILGLDTPTSGRALVNGVAYRTIDRPLRVVGSLLDAGAVHGGRSARSHLECLAVTNDLPRSRVGEVLEMTGLSGVARKRVGGFSLGMRQRLGIAAALLGDPPILMFDEPVNGLDPEGVVWARDLMRSLAAEGRTVLVSSHLMSEMALTADHLIVIGRGALIADAGMADLLRSSSDGVLVRTPQSRRLADLLTAEGARVVAEPDGGLVVTGLTVQAVSRVAAAGGVEIHELARRQASLEEAYLRLTDTAVQYRATTPGTRGTR
ncbi:ATP-binding cassette domain-containing protein [Actinomadura oligospora]|uniref:ATP-binding cassette domain-containing protein n=1 Tax=Actinomadura oligospora TaxID=111804 RepID=UPI0004B4AF28|nr:ATP-binding cassette domain-containing protein [Actinomadura oligospora]